MVRTFCSRLVGVAFISALGVFAGHAAEVSESSVSAFVEEIKSGDAASPQRMIH